MAKRKRLEVPSDTVFPELETKSSSSRARMPIADVAGDTAGRAALEEVARAMTEAEGEGRVVKKIRIADIDLKHITRDRMVFDAEEMEALENSLKDRGQQAPIEVLRVGRRYGLISGLRRLHALRALGQETVLAFVRRPESASDAYVAMIEENEIRAPLSFYERANVAAEAVEAGVFPDTKTAISSLYSRAPAAKRSKIARFVDLRNALGAALHFPAAIPEKLGLALVSAIDADKALARRISDALRKTPASDPGAERRALERALKKSAPAKAGSREIAPGLRVAAGKGRVVLSGKAVDTDFLAALEDWAVSHAKGDPPSL